MATEPTRTVIIYDENGNGKDGVFKDIKKGMIFRIMEEDGSGPVKDDEGFDVFIAEGNAYSNHGLWTVDVSAFTGEEPK